MTRTASAPSRSRRRPHKATSARSGLSTTVATATAVSSPVKSGVPFGELPLYRVKLPAGPRLHHLPRQLSPENPLRQPCDLDQPLQVDPGLVADLVQHVHRIFGGNIARGLRREGTSANAR